VPKAKGAEVAAMLKAIHAEEDREAALQKARLVIEKMTAMKLKAAARTVEEGIAVTLTYTDFPREHWRKIRTNNPMERVMREIRRRTRVVGNFPDGNSALMLVTARRRYVAGRKWGTRKYMNIRLLKGGTAIEDALEA
jgi:putative transposase